MRTTTLLSAMLICGILNAQQSFDPYDGTGLFNDGAKTKRLTAYGSNLPEENGEDPGFKKGALTLALVGGTSMPFGRYAAVDAGQDDGLTYGFADPGTVFNLNFMIRLAKRFGTTVSLSYFDNPVSASRYAEHSSPYLNLGTIADYNYTVTTGSWRTNTFMLGIAYKSINPNVSVEIHFKAGLMSVRTPSVLIEEVNDLGEKSNFFEHKTEQHFSLGTAPGMQFRLRLFKELHFNLNSEFVFGQINVDQPLYMRDTTYFYFDQVIIANFNLMAGLSWEFKE